MNAKNPQSPAGPWLYYLSQMATSVLALMVPVLLLHYAGVSFFGVVAFATVLQACLQVSDLGLASTLTRASAMCTTETQWVQQAMLLRKAERWVAVSGSFTGLVLVWPILLIYQNWSQASATDPVSLQDSLWLIMITIATKNQLEIYRGVLVGARQLNWLAIEVLLVAVVRILLIIGLIQWGVLTLPAYFVLNIFSNLFEIFLSRSRSFSMIACFVNGYELPEGPTIVPWRFSLSMAFAAFLWILFSQSDKLYLSHIWTIQQFAEFSAATMLASGILIVTLPVQNIVSARLATHHANGKSEYLISEYCQATRWVGLLVWPLCAVLMFRAEEILQAWTGNSVIAQHAEPVLMGYAFGNGLVALGGVTFYLQFAIGKIRLHLLGAILFLAFLLPSLALAAEFFSLKGAGAVWAGANLLFFLTWLPFVHRKILPLPYGRWLRKDVLPALLYSTIVMMLLSPLSISEHRSFAVIQLGIFYGLCLLITGCAIEDSRRWLLHSCKKIIKIISEA
ncbi:MAG: lipopolysaccharide biosynthesis protein [Curvibacter lanceolatus]|uniref:lipopolysaccharide biosynthesis protein n=1 Tax=Curvibacter lanceolatus TaxID=86182 RepID=UPI0023523B49|nr:lipopolysaccharide biosynthesis protein [Curvibacter lanceolatus]MBV5295903.1 lipopolysaccharide biosynthesis protein [Curvibacter lanceolatus]